ncbi:serpin family protein [Streptomyces sp. NPDC087849]|uniref:serpin family protein n=1 Tax=Streptomyces sp. NPDC087849 TaxID=3365808 RepID=UPI00381787DF
MTVRGGAVMQPTATSVSAVNRLTARWATGLGPADTVFSATTVWPLLALLAHAAEGPARSELEEAVGMRADDAAATARDLLAALKDVRGARSAIGLWTGRALPLNPAWASGLPTDTLGVLTGDPHADRKALDAWASDCTDGLIRSMPVPLDGGTELVLAAAQAVRTRWLQPFSECEMAPEKGPWAGRYLVGLRRETSLLDRVGVAETEAGRLTVLKVLGDTGVDVHLLLGDPDMPPGQVLSAGAGTLAGRYRTVPGHLLPAGDPGPGLETGTERSLLPEPTLAVRTSPYSLGGDHDLLLRPALFGLSAATDMSHGHFPGISGAPLAVRSARQAAVAVFDAAGFEAASLCAVGMAAAGMPPAPRYLTRRVEVSFDRPFGFLAVHRTSRLVLAAGWVAEPTVYPVDEGDA